ncbi:MAG: cytochrome b N-terminal domain-containing protein [Anaerolineaceae bacterium]|nr:cytochrome b N-terminal domain-containing protein [Anaerolineaceae bacterium]
MSTLGNWLDERLGWKTIWQNVFIRKVPKVNWFYTLGSATMIVGMIQGVTGILLTLYYVPSPDQAYDSVQYITNVLPAGWFIRGLHHWGSSAMLILAVLHMLRVIIFGAYKFPREITWFTGVALLLMAVGFGFTGYLLPWDQKAYWATTVGTRIIGVVPWVGEAILRIARGGPELSALSLVRFFGVHVWFLPAVSVALVGVHIYLVIKLGISAPPKRDE